MYVLCYFNQISPKKKKNPPKSKLSQDHIRVNHKSSVEMAKIFFFSYASTMLLAVSHLKSTHFLLGNFLLVLKPLKSLNHMDFQYHLGPTYTEKLLQGHMFPSLSCSAVIAFTLQ